MGRRPRVTLNSILNQPQMRGAPIQDAEATSVIRIPPDAVRAQHGFGGPMSVNASCPHCRQLASFTPQNWTMHSGPSREATATCPSCHEEVRLFHLNQPNPHRTSPGEQQSPPEVWMHPAPLPPKPDAEFLPSVFFESAQLYRVHPVL